eukprot:COSAG02_NODE_57008_length_282_cov_1.131148_1_plen_45_part_10
MIERLLSPDAATVCYNDWAVVSWDGYKGQKQAAGGQLQCLLRAVS